MNKIFMGLCHRVWAINGKDLNAAPREAWLKEHLAAIPAGSSILDAGAGELSKKQYCSHLEYVSQDFGQYEGGGNSKGLQTGTWDQSKLDIICDITSIPRPDASFDAILCVEVFEHLPDPLSALKEFARLLRPGGTLLLTAPFCSFVHFAPYFFGTGFSEYWYKKHLPDVGFAVAECTANGNFSAFLSQEVGRIPDIANRYCGAGEMKLTFFDRLGLHLTQHLLSKMLQRDAKSQEFACFGYHVMAKKM